MKLSRLPLLVQPLVYPALRSAAEHHVRHEKKTLNRTRCRAGVPLESVYRRALTDLKAPSAHSNSSIEQFCQEVNRIYFNSWLSLTAEKHNLVLKVKWSMFFFSRGSQTRLLEWLESGPSGGGGARTLLSAKGCGWKSPTGRENRT